MAVNVQSTPEHPNRRPPGWDKILWAPKKKFTRKPIRFQDLINDNIEDDQQTPPTRKESSYSSRSSTTPTFNEKPAYKPVILNFDDDDE